MATHSLFITHCSLFITHHSLPKKMFRTRIFLCILLFLTLTTSCHQKDDNAIVIHRFDKVLFETPTDQLATKLNQVRDEFNTPLLVFKPEEPAYISMAQAFVADPTLQDVHRIVDSVFGDMAQQSQQLGKAFKKAQELYPEMRYDKVYTFLFGYFDYSKRIVCNDHELLISLDQYVLPYTKQYNYFNNPLFIVQQSQPQNLVPDCMTTIARQFTTIPDNRDMTLLDYMIAEGKAIYFAQQTLPNTPDSLLLRYTAEQLKWMQDNEKNVWAFFLQTKLLYETDYMRFHNFIDDAPKTNAFRDSAPRTTDYIGWRIVSMYMDKTNTTIQQLFEETDAQRILTISKYRPN